MVGHAPLERGIGVRVPVRQHEFLRKVLTIKIQYAEERIATKYYRSSIKKGMWYVYILKCEDGSLYTGFTNNIDRRFTEHKTKEGAKYTRSRKPVEILHTEEFENKKDAMRREYEIKGWRRGKKLGLIKSS